MPLNCHPCRTDFCSLNLIHVFLLEGSVWTIWTRGIPRNGKFSTGNMVTKHQHLAAPLFSDIPNSAVWDVFCQVRTRMQIKFDNNRQKQETGVMEWMDWAWFSLAIQRSTGLIMFTLEPLNVRASHQVDFHPFAIWTFCNFWQLLWF